VTHAQAKIHASLETKSSHNQAAAEGAALRGELGVERQLVALSALYLELRSEGKLAEALAVKAMAIEINATRSDPL